MKVNQVVNEGIIGGISKGLLKGVSNAVSPGMYDKGAEAVKSMSKKKTDLLPANEPKTIQSPKQPQQPQQPQDTSSPVASFGNTPVQPGQRLEVVINKNRYFKNDMGYWFLQSGPYITDSQRVSANDANKLDNLSKSNQNVTSVEIKDSRPVTKNKKKGR